MTEEKRRLKFEYNVSPDYKIYAVNGFHGGITPKGDLMINIFSERNSIPVSETFEVNPNGMLEPVETEKSSSIIRDVIFGISIDPQEARSFARWLNQKADEFDKMVSVNKEQING